MVISQTECGRLFCFPVESFGPSGIWSRKFVNRLYPRKVKEMDSRVRRNDENETLIVPLGFPGEHINNR